MGVDGDLFKRLEDVLLAEAEGSADVVPKEVVRTVVNDAGDTMRQTGSVKRPDIKLAMKLLDNRIGGPQDWC